jgi:2,3-bisphosphoglycerate-dependent phosphoglycerate mutase
MTAAKHPPPTYNVRMPTLVCIRHGQSQWNLENRFTGWVDQDLSPTGIVEATNAGALLRDEGLAFDAAFTSMLTRAIHTLDIVLNGMEQSWIPVTKAWQLNERHYGALQGLNKAETAAEHGDKQVHIWRRSYDVPPPSVTRDDCNWPGNDRRYAAVPADQLPLTECLKDTVDRVVPYWNEHIKPLVAAGRMLIVAAHGNSLRALVKHLDCIADDEITSLNIPTGVPMIYDFADDMTVKGRRYLGDADAIAQAAAAVATQGSSKS